MNILNKPNKKGADKSPKVYKHTELKRRLATMTRTLDKRKNQLEVLQSEVDFLQKKVNLYRAKLGFQVDN